MNRRGRPVLGAIAGLFFGLFLAMDLWLLGVVASDSIVLTLLPVLGLALGLGLGLKPVLGGRGPSPSSSAPAA